MPCQLAIAVSALQLSVSVPRSVSFAPSSSAQSDARPSFPEPTAAPSIHYCLSAASGTGVAAARRPGTASLRMGMARSATTASAHEWQGCPACTLHQQHRHETPSVIVRTTMRNAMRPAFIPFPEGSILWLRRGEPIKTQSVPRLRTSIRAPAAIQRTAQRQPHHDRRAPLPRDPPCIDWFERIPGESTRSGCSGSRSLREHIAPARGRESQRRGHHAHC